MKNILFVASESVPFIKTGGLADVVGSLPKSLNKEQYDVRIFIPKYGCMKPVMKEKITHITSFYMEHNGKEVYVGVMEAVVDEVKFYFIDNEFYFSGPKPYCDDGLFEIEKYTFFSKAVLEALPHIDFKPDVVHCHDWQTGMIPVYLKDRYMQKDFYKDMKSVMTIHNLKFQGKWGINDVKNITGLAYDYFTYDKLEAYGDANLLKGGIVYADAVTTVSETYAQEIQTEFYGEGLHGLLQTKKDTLLGIVNGIDYTDFNPETNPHIYRNYSAENFRKEKIKNKRALQKELGLCQNDKTMLIGIVSRLTDQKGLDLIDCIMEELCQDDIQIVVLGTGEMKFENMFRHFDWKYPEKVSANIYYSEALSHKIYAACDAFLMPSLFEPCGLSQLMALRYGTLPIVRKTGGLKDTVEPYNEYEGTGTGFSFANFNAHEMLTIIRYAEAVYYKQKRSWNKMVERAMAADFSWTVSAVKYEALYDDLMKS